MVNSCRITGNSALQNNNFDIILVFFGEQVLISLLKMGCTKPITDFLHKRRFYMNCAIWSWAISPSYQILVEKQRFIGRKKQKKKAEKGHMCGCHGGALVLHDNQSPEYRGRGARTLCTQGLLIRLTAGRVGTHTRHHAGTPPTHTHT